MRKEGKKTNRCSSLSFNLFVSHISYWFELWINAHCNVDKLYLRKGLELLNLKHMLICLP